MVLALDIPCVFLSSSLKRYTWLHVIVTRSFVAQKCFADSSPANAVTKNLLLHSSSDMELSTSNTIRSIKALIQNMDLPLNNMTCMTLRGSHATCILHTFRSGMFGMGMSEEMFLELVSKHMNRLEELLCYTYAPCCAG